MTIIRFADVETERFALGKLAGRFSFKTWATGETMVPEPALSYLALRESHFTPKAGPVMNALRRYEILLPLRFNDGQPVPDELVSDTMLELACNSSGFLRDANHSRSLVGRGANFPQ